MITGRGLGSLRRAAKAGPEFRFDLRVPLAVERRLLPALLLVGLVAAAGASAVDAPALIWGWLAVYAVNSSARFLLATAYGDARHPIAAESRVARQYLACAALDVVLMGCPARHGSSSRRLSGRARAGSRPPAPCCWRH